MRRSVYHLTPGDVVRSFNGAGDQVISTYFPKDPKKIRLELMNNKTGKERTVLWGKYTTVSMHPDSK